MNQRIGYARVSTDDQNLDLQRDALHKTGCALIYEEAGGQLATLEGDAFWSGQHVFSRSVIAALQPALFEQWLKWIRANQ